MQSTFPPLSLLQQNAVAPPQTLLWPVGVVVTVIVFVTVVVFVIVVATVVTGKLVVRMVVTKVAQVGPIEVALFRLNKSLSSSLK